MNKSKRFTFKKEQRLRKKNDINKVFKKGFSIANKNIVLYFLKNNLNFNRICVVTSKKTGNAVRRNRLRRLVKEFFRLNQYNFIINYDFIIILRPNNIINDYVTAEKNIIHLLTMKKMLKI